MMTPKAESVEGFSLRQCMDERLRSDNVQLRAKLEQSRIVNFCLALALSIVVVIWWAAQ